MLLMDSLGGTSKALMIACVSPSHMWADETISTLNYATRTMNIKNKPVIQMDAKEQIIYDSMGGNLYNYPRENNLNSSIMQMEGIWELLVEHWCFHLLVRANPRSISLKAAIRLLVLPPSNSSNSLAGVVLRWVVGWEVQWTIKTRVWLATGCCRSSSLRCRDSEKKIRS